MSFITDDLHLIASHLRQGNIAAIPTETVYGLAADAQNDLAIQKVFAAKQRPKNHPLIVHILPEWDLSQWVADIPALAHAWMEKYWPGPLTLIFNTNPGQISPWVTGQQSTVALRAPKHPQTQKLLELMGCPLVAPSANPYEKLSPTTAEHVLKHFPLHDFPILQGGRCQMGIESTIIDMAHEPGRVLRPGPLDIGHQTKNAINFAVPGHQLKHYQPNKPCFYFSGIEQIPAELENYYLMAFQPIGTLKVAYHFPLERNAVYHEFYYQLQRADESQASIILIELPRDQLKYEVICDRIVKAARPLR